MATKTLDFNTLTAANPYVIGSAPDNLTGYALATGSGSVKIFNTGTKELALASGTRAIFYRHYSNGSIKYIAFGDHTQSPAASPVSAFDINYDNIFISRHGFYEGV